MPAVPPLFKPPHGTPGNRACTHLTHQARWAAARGFTLLELMVVVVIVTVLATMAIPLVTDQLRERRAQEAAERVASVYRTARMRAMGRGSAILVRFTDSTGRFDVFEAQRGTSDAPVGSSDAACAALPVSSCLLPNWNGAVGESYRELTRFDLGANPAYEDVVIKMHSESAQVAALDVCFTPMGRAFFRTNTAQPLAPLTSTHRAELYRVKGTDPVGRKRNVLVLPNGAARLTL